jgi:hypothetical protein
MSNLPPPFPRVFPEIKALLDAERTPTDTLSRNLHTLLQTLLTAWPFDEGWYLQTYRDIFDAVRTGKVTSGREHYICRGYFEGRLPARPEVDDVWYKRTYPDVAAAIAALKFTGPFDHFVWYGYYEGRLPSAPRVEAKWYLLTYPDVEKTIKAGDVESATDHFVRFGYREGRRPCSGSVDRYWPPVSTRATGSSQRRLPAARNGTKQAMASAGGRDWRG